MNRIKIKKFALLLALTLLSVAVSNAQDENSSECVRAKPAPILIKRKFPNKTFRLRKNKEFPFEYVGFETVRLKNGDNLTIKNYGCENYSLDFRFETKRFKGSLKRAKYWYQAAVQLMNSVIGGLKKNQYLPRAGTKALKEHIKKSKTLRFDDYVYFLDTEIKEAFHLATVKKSANGKYVVEISFGVGPL